MQKAFGSIKWAILRREQPLCLDQKEMFENHHDSFFLLRRAGNGLALPLSSRMKASQPLPIFPNHRLFLHSLQPYRHRDYAPERAGHTSPHATSVACCDNLLLSSVGCDDNFLDLEFLLGGL